MEEEDIVMMEENISKKGFQEGYQDGLVTGKIEGRSLGRQHGSKAAQDFGHYYGFSVTACQFLQQKSSMSRSEQKAYKLLKAVVDAAPEIKNYENGSGSLANFHSLLEQSKKRFEDARRYLQMKKKYNAEDDSLSF